MICHGAPVWEAWLCSLWFLLAGPSFLTLSGFRYPVQRPSVSSPLMVRVEPSLNNPSTSLFHSLLPSLLPSALPLNKQIMARTEFSFIVCYDMFESLHALIDRTYHGSIWRSGSGSCSMLSMLDGSLAWDTCLRESRQCHACPRHWFTIPPTMPQSIFITQSSTFLV